MKKKGRRWRMKQRKRTDTLNLTQGRGSDYSFIMLRQWMKTGGFKGCHLQPANFNDTGRGLMATKMFNHGDAIVSIPYNLLITTETVLQSYLAPVIKRQSPPLTAVQILSVFLICERQRGATSKWHPYISVLPDAYTNAAYWNQTDMTLVSPSLREIATRQKEDVSASFDALASLISEVEKHWPELRGALTLRAYRWAWSTINTRSVYMKHPASHYVSTTADHHHALAPLLDLLNHSTHAQITASFNQTTQCYEIITETPYKKYDQVFISYGPHDNHKLMVEYGFLLPRNPHSVLLLKLADIEKRAAEIRIPGIRIKMDIIRSNDFTRKEWKSVLVQDGRAPDENDHNTLITLCRHLLNEVIHDLSLIQDPVEKTAHSDMLLTLRDEQLIIARTNLAKLDQGQLQPG